MSRPTILFTILKYKVSLKKSVTESGKNAPDDFDFSGPHINLKHIKLPNNHCKSNFILFQMSHFKSTFTFGNKSENANFLIFGADPLSEIIGLLSLSGSKNISLIWV